MSYRPSAILVTGGAGFIGCNFVRYMLATDPEVFISNLDNLTYAGSRENLRNLPDESRHEFIKGDICDRGLVDEVLRKYSIDTIVHFAAESHVDRSITGPAIFIQTNVAGTLTLLEAARQYWLDEKNHDASNCRFHHISTDEVYGSLGPDDPPFVETTLYAPNSPYSASKAGADHLVRAYLHTYGLPVTTSNCSNNYGPYQHQEKFIPTVIRSCIEGKDIPVYGDGTNIRDWLHVEDHCSGIDYVIRKGEIGETYNVGGGTEINNLEVVRRICEIMDETHPEAKPHDKLVKYVSDRLGHDWRYSISSEKLETELLWKKRFEFSSGLRDTIDFYSKLFS